MAAPSTPRPRGGELRRAIPLFCKAVIVASFLGVDATAAITVKLTGDVFAAGADPTTKQGFDAAAVDPDPAAQYVSPQWTKAVIAPPQWAAPRENAGERR
jgi:hypothetical protein